MSKNRKKIKQIYHKMLWNDSIDYLIRKVSFIKENEEKMNNN